MLWPIRQVLMLSGQQVEHNGLCGWNHDDRSIFAAANESALHWKKDCGRECRVWRHRLLFNLKEQVRRCDRFSNITLTVKIFQDTNLLSCWSKVEKEKERYFILEKDFLSNIWNIFVISTWLSTPGGLGKSEAQISSRLQMDWIGWEATSPFPPPSDLLSCIIAHSGVSGTFQTAKRPSPSPLRRYFIHLPSLENMRYLKTGGHSRFFCATWRSNWQNMSDLPVSAVTFDLLWKSLLSTMQFVGNL